MISQGNTAWRNKLGQGRSASPAREAPESSQAAGRDSTRLSLPSLPRLSMVLPPRMAHLQVVEANIVCPPGDEHPRAALALAIDDELAQD
jgi:hypothetical protein